MINVAMIVRSSMRTVCGGDVIQAEQTAHVLTCLGIHVDIRRGDEQIDYEQYHLLHFFNITRPAEILYHIRRTDKPFVVSTILVDYSEFDKRCRKGISGAVLKHFRPHTIEYIKSLARWLNGTDKIMSRRYIRSGQRRAIVEVISKARLLLPNSESESRKLQKLYGCSTDQHIIPNGVDLNLFQYDCTVTKDPDLVLCVARIEGIKNQLNLIKALNHTRYKLLLIGTSAPGHIDYYNTCRKLAAANVQFIAHLPQQRLVEFYGKAKVHVLPSWFETTGLASLEGAAMGCNIVVTDKGFTRDYFGGLAEYCHPASSQSIFAAVDRAATLPVNEKLKDRINARYTWQAAGRRTAEGYQRIISEQ